MDIIWHDLPSRPGLPVAFLRAALARGERQVRLPESGLRCPVSVDPQHLKRYRALCAAPDDGLLPPAYPHLLAFPLQMRLLTADESAFPLLGLVHLRNRVRVLRPLDGLGPFRVSVHLRNPQPHAKGMTFDLVTWLEDSSGLLWEGESRMLRRNAQRAERSREKEAPTAAEAGPEAGEGWIATADIGRSYARLSGDYNPIHLSDFSARLFGFPGAIAHGLWSKGRALGALAGHLPRSDYEISVSFHKPLLLPGRVELLADPHAGRFQLRDGQQRLHLRGTWRAL